MPPKATTAPKKEKFTDAQAESQCLTYLNLQNRPYNATDIHKNLHEPFSKAVTQKALTALHERNEIICKVNGKTAVYCALQGGGVDTETIAALDEEVKTLNQAVQDIKSENKKLSDGTASYS